MEIRSQLRGDVLSVICCTDCSQYRFADIESFRDEHEGHLIKWREIKANQSVDDDVFNGMLYAFADYLSRILQRDAQELVSELKS